MSRHRPTHHAPRTLAPILALLGLVIALGAGLLAPGANAATVQEGSLSMTSDENDYIGQGQTYSYDSAAGDVFGTTTTAG